MTRAFRWGGVWAFALLWSVTAAAAQTGPAKAAIEKDAECTTCHNETWPKPVLAFYQTRHGNKADARTPGCRNCHGQSDGHLKDPGTPPDVVFARKSKHLSTANARSRARSDSDKGSR